MLRKLVNSGFLFAVILLGLLVIVKKVNKPSSINSNTDGVAHTQTSVNVSVIYGPDDRQDTYQVSDERLKSLASSTVGLFKAYQISEDTKTKVSSLQTSNFGESYDLCPDEPYRDQPSGAFCSGSLVGPDLIATAGHCITSEDVCKSTKFVFGFSISKEGTDPTKVSSNEVYGCQKLLGREQVGTGADYAVIKLDRVVKNHTALKINRSGMIAKDTPLVVIGHPCGLPTKISGGAKVRSTGSSGFFVANLDTYGGNSGSAVFNAVTGQIEGILVRGETDFVYNSTKGCRESNRVPDDGGRGEDVTSISEAAAHIPSGMFQQSPTMEILRREVHDLHFD